MSARSMRRARAREIQRAVKASSRRSRRLTLGTGAALTASVLCAPAAEAATFTVTSLSDVDEQEGTLREEVEDANQADGADTVLFQSGLSGTITLAGAANPELNVYNDSLTIQGPGAGQIAVSGNDVSRIFDLYGFESTDDDVVFSGLTLRDGSSFGSGGAILNRPGPGPAPAADLKIADSVLTGNHTRASGGAVYSRWGALTIVNTEITANQSGLVSGSSSFAYGGGGVSSDYANRDGSEAQAVVIQNSILSDNMSLYGGSNQGHGGGARIRGSYGDVLIEGTTISGNQATGRGGGLAVYRPAEDGATMAIRNSTISNNSSGYNGGGIWWLGTNSADPGAEVIENTTVSGNEAAFYGGGILSYNDNDTPRAIRNSTIVDNQAGTSAFATGDEQGGGIYAHQEDDPASGFGASGGGEDELFLSSTIVAGNAPSDLGNNEGETDFDGVILGDFNLIEDPGDVGVTENPSGSNVFGQDPQLGPLASNGGPTETHLPMPSSPAIDAGTSNGLLTDQRALPRTADRPEVPNRSGSDATDIGAVEIQLDAPVADETVACKGLELKRTDGTEGDDDIAGTDLPDAIYGFGGDDSVTSLTGADCVIGGAGIDGLDGGGANDLVRGGAGGDRVEGQDGDDRLKGGRGRDVILGGDGTDNLKGARGADKMRGGEGRDHYKGGGGSDRVNSVDTGRDKVNCGAGDDKATVDELDNVNGNCETVRTVASKTS